MIVGQRSTPAPPVSVGERDCRVYSPTALSWGITRMAPGRQAGESPPRAVETPNHHGRLMPFRGVILSAWGKREKWGTTTSDAPPSPLSPFSPLLAYAPFSRLCIGWACLLCASCEDGRRAPRLLPVMQRIKHQSFAGPYQGSHEVHTRAQGSTLRYPLR
jgi:hypothetical protein